MMSGEERTMFADLPYKELIDLAIRQDQDAITELYNRAFHTGFYSLQLKIDDRDEAMDVFQEGFLRALKKLDTIKEPDAFPAWFGKILRNTMLNMTSKKRALTFSQLTPEEKDTEFLADAEDETIAFRPEESYSKEEIARIVRGMLDVLSEEQRDCILMRFDDNLSYKEIAEELDCAEGTVKSRIAYAKKILQAKAKEMEKNGYTLRSVMPVPFLIWALRLERGLFESDPEAAAIRQTMLQNILLSDSVKAAAGAGVKATAGKGVAAAKAVTAGSQAGKGAAGATVLGSTVVKGAAVAGAVVITAAGGFALAKRSASPVMAAPQAETAVSEAVEEEPTQEVVETNEPEEQEVEETVETPANPYRQGDITELSTGERWVDLDNDGVEEPLAIDLFGIEHGVIQAVGVSLNDQYSEIDARDMPGYYMDDVSFYLVHVEDEESWSYNYLYVNAMTDNNMATVFIWDLNNWQPEYIGKTDDPALGFHTMPFEDEKEDASSFTLSGVTRDSRALSTVAIQRHYHVGDDGFPEASEDWYDIGPLEFEEQPALTTKQSVSAQIIEKTTDGTVPEYGTDTTIPAGTVLTFLRTDEEGHTDFTADDGTIYRITSEAGADYYASVDGISVWDLFDGVLYAQ